MSESVDDLLLTPRSRFLKNQAFRFEQAWQAALRGEAPPSVEDFLTDTMDPERTRIIGELQRIERIYRVRLSFGKADTIHAEGSGTGTGEEIPPGLTIETTPPPGVAEVARPITEHRLDPTADGSNEVLGNLNPFEADPIGMGSFPEPSFAVDSEVGRRVTDSSSIHLPLIDTWGRDIEVPPIASTFRTADGGRPFLKGYEILGELGRGGMGVVYKANQQGLNRLVAIKMVLGGDHARDEDLARFKIEAEAVASIQHANIVQIYEVGEEDGTPYFSLEFIDGGTLHQLINGKPLPPSEASEIALQLAHAMGHFHEKGVIHRDLKPANVLMTLQGTPKITDFGLAKRLEGHSSQTRTGSLMGTPSYMAPEQANGDTSAIGPLSDLYSLGAILYEMLTGRPPFQGATMLDTIEQVRSQEPVPPRRLQPKVPRDLETICLKCLQKEPAKRYSSANELGGDLQRFLGGDAIKARPVGRLEMGWRWARRNPRYAALYSCVALLAIMVFTVLVVARDKMDREFRTIEDARQITLDRIHRGTEAVAKGDVRAAIEIIGVPDPILERTPSLNRLREELHKLRSQVSTFAEFRRLLDVARYEGFLESEQKLARAQDHFRELFTFYDEIESKTGRGEFGLPPLNPLQLQLFKEDIFDTFLIAALVEYDHKAEGKDLKTRQEVARLAISWLDRAEKLLPPTRALYSRRVFFREELDDQEGAEADRRRAEETEPNSAVDLFWRGYSDLKRAEAAKYDNPRLVEDYYKIASEGFARHLKVRPEHYWSRFDWASCKYLLKQLHDANLGYTDCIERDPDAPWPYHNRAKASAELNDFQAAVLDETKAIQRDATYLEAYLGRSSAYKNLKRFADAIVDVEEAIKLAASSEELVFERGVLRLADKQFELALADFDTSVKNFPRMVGPYRNRARTRLLLHDFQGALADWTVAVNLNAKDVESRYFQGALEMGLRRYDDALKTFDKVLAIQPKHELTLLAKARIHRWRSDNVQALEILNQVVSQMESSKRDRATKASYLNERLDFFRSVGRLEEAEADAQQSIQLNPNQIDAYFTLAEIERRRGKPRSEAIPLFDAMLKANPRSIKVRLLRAEYFRELGRWEESISELEEARTLKLYVSPTVVDLMRDSVLAARGEYQQAVAHVEEILNAQKRPDGPVVYAAACVMSLAAGSAKKTGNEPNAERYANRAVSLMKTVLGECYFDFEYAEKERMETNPALGPIADRPEFRQTLLYPQTQ